MIRVLFICLGNICRSPMAEFVMKDMVGKAGLTEQFEIASAATSREEIGNPEQYGTRNILKKLGISTEGKYARRMTAADYRKYDLLIGMEQSNIRSILRITGGDPEGKVTRLLDYTDNPRDIADPWYTGEFDLTYQDIKEGCQGLLAYLQRNRLIN